MAKKRRLDKSEITDPSAAFDLFHGSLELDFDFFDSGVTRFNAIVLTQPILLSPGSISSVGKLGQLFGVESLSLGKFKFFARIAGLDSPHSFLPDPCDPAIASDPTKQLEFIKLHTEFYSTKDSSIMCPKVGDTVVVELQQNAFSYNLYVGEYVGLLDSTGGNAAALQDCSGIASNFVNIPTGPTWGTGQKSPPTNVGPSNLTNTDDWLGVPLINKLSSNVGRSQYKCKSYNSSGAPESGQRCPWAGAIIHYDQTWNMAGSIAAAAKGGVGYHFVIDKNGGIHQVESLDNPMYHGGPPNNGHRIGIALNNYGFWDEKNGADPFPAGKTYKGHDMDKEFKEGPNTAGSKRMWEAPYTKAQKNAYKKLITALMGHYGFTKDDVYRHSQKTTGVKQDPGPFWPHKMSNNPGKS